MNRPAQWRTRLAVLVLPTMPGCVADSSEMPEETGAFAGPPPAAVDSYDSALAARLGADEYGMRSYVFAFLTAGPNHGTLDSATAAEIQRAHLDNVFRLAEAGSLLLQGPFMDRTERDTPLRGFYIFNVSSVEEARALTETDPAIQRGWLEMELRPWYGSAALQEVYGIHRRIRRRNP